jgi:hypothetical protein
MITADEAIKLVEEYKELNNTEEHRNIPEVLKCVAEDIQQAARLGKNYHYYLVNSQGFYSKPNLVENHLKVYGPRVLSKELEKYGYTLKKYLGIYEISWGKK